LNLRYDVSKKLAQEWVDSDQVLPLLDGLDEVKAESRAACVGAINTFRQSHGLLPLVITSRTADYEAITEPLRLHGAMVVRPLTREQVNSYLTELGPSGESVRAALHEDSSLWELLDSPLLLNVVTVAYAGQRERPTLVSGTVAERRHHLFGSYVDQMLRRRAAGLHYLPEQTVHWLCWLARQMADHGQTVFYLEHLQIDWLLEKQRWAIRVCIGLVFGLVGGLVFGLVGRVYGMRSEYHDTRLVLGLVFGLCGALVFGLVSALNARPVVGLVLGLVVGLLAGFIGGLVSIEFGIWAGWLVCGLGFGLVGGLCGWRSGRLVSDQEISCVEQVRWSWSGVREARSLIPTVGLACGLVGGLLVGLNPWLTVAGAVLVQMLYELLVVRQAMKFLGFFVEEWAMRLVVGLVVGLFGMLVAILVVGLSFREIETRALPNQGIHRSARNAVAFGLIFGLAFGLAFGLVVGLIFGLIFGLACGLVGGLGFGLVVGLGAGGAACLKHFVLRLWLIHNGSTPWNYAKFLDRAADRLLLRKVGGGYAFIHRMLLDYFAARYVEPAVEVTKLPKASSIGDEL
jgi:MFS family permease